MWFRSAVDEVEEGAVVILRDVTRARETVAESMESSVCMH